MHAFEEIARPVIFEHADEAFPYWGKGSSMLLADSKHYYWVTAAHVLKNMRGTVDALRIFPSDESRISLPFDEQYTIKPDRSDDDDYRDIFVLRINSAAFDASGDSPLTAQDVQHGLLPAEDLAVGSVLWIIGYPAERNQIDYEMARIKNSRAVIRAIYLGPNSADHCHAAKISTSIRLESFDGLSGSPVFYLQPAKHGEEEVLIARLVGMLIRGTASSELVHFISAKVIGRLIQLARDGDA